VAFICGTATSQIRRQRPQSKARSHITQGIDHYNSGDLNAARSEFRRALVLDTQNAIAYAYLADIAYRDKQFRLADELADKALKHNDKSYRAMGVKGLVAIEDGKLKQAEPFLQQALRLCDNEKDRTLFRSALLRARGDDTVLPKPSNENAETLLQDEQLNKKAETGPKPRVAVFPFEDANVATESTGLGESISEMMTTALISYGRFEVVERMQLQNVISEQALGQSGAIDSESAIAVGKILGVEAVAIGSLSKLRNVIEGDARLIEVETGKAITAASGNIETVDNLRELANDLAQKLGQSADVLKRKEAEVKE